jgi:hypothetical protein
MTTAHTSLLLGEPLALDLVNTRIHRDGVDGDLLDRSALNQWLRAERARVDWTGRTGMHGLEAICTLRHVLHEPLRTRPAHQRGPAAPVQALKNALALPTPGAQLAWDTRGPMRRRLGPPRVSLRCSGSWPPTRWSF